MPEADDVNPARMLKGAEARAGELLDLVQRDAADLRGNDALPDDQRKEGERALDELAKALRLLREALER